METMMQELSEKVWSNPHFHKAARRIELAWLGRELGVSASKLKEDEVKRLMEAAAILACSDSQLHRRAAFRVATYAYELFGAETMPLDQALRVVLTRLGNFPSVSTRSPVEQALPRMPFPLVAEELASADERAIKVHGQQFFLTDFQHQLWLELIDNRRIALSAPTSAGKSFVLQTYLSATFKADVPLAIVYLVPTRALIAQVAETLLKQSGRFAEAPPDVITVPMDADTELPARAIYVMTQERAQLALSAHPDFQANIVIVDEAHCIGDSGRGVLLQWVIDDLIQRNPSVQVLFASPTIRNLNIFGRLFGLSDVREIASFEQAVAQNFLIITIESVSKGRIAIQTSGDGTQPSADVARFQLDQTLASRIDKLVHISYVLAHDQSSIIYANGADEAERIAIQLADLMSKHEPTAYQSTLAELAEEAVHHSYVLAECVKRGVAFHYSNMPTQVRRAVENAVAQGEITYLVCTSTLLQGVNLPTKNIFMFAPEKGRTRPLESADFWNLAGRAGRLRREFHGNIFLIDYAKWKKKPLDGPKDSIIVPAIETTVKEKEADLVKVISDDRVSMTRDLPDLETTFVRLFSDMKSGVLPSTFKRIGIESSDINAQTIEQALKGAAGKVTLPAALLRRTPNISVHKQERLFKSIRAKVVLGEVEARTMIPSHPREPNAYDSYATILELCHKVVLGIDTAKNLHRFHALIALRWMQGWPLPQIIDNQIARRPGKSRRKVIRDTLDLIEGDIRYQAVRLFGCYGVLLAHALETSGCGELGSNLLPLPLFLEVGACDKTMISFISLGLSRVTAIKLNELSARKDLDVIAAKAWLQDRPLETLGLPSLLLDEVQAVIGS